MQFGRSNHYIGLFQFLPPNYSRDFFPASGNLGEISSVIFEGENGKLIQDFSRVLGVFIFWEAWRDFFWILGIIPFGILNSIWGLAKISQESLSDSFLNLNQTTPETLKLSPETVEISSGILVRFLQRSLRDFSRNVEVISSGIFESFLGCFHLIGKYSSRYI